MKCCETAELGCDFGLLRVLEPVRTRGLPCVHSPLDLLASVGNDSYQNDSALGIILPMSDEADGRTAEPFRGLAFNLSSLGYSVSKGFQETLPPFDLHPREFAVLRAVGLQEGLSQQALGDGLQIPRSRMVAIVDELEAARTARAAPEP